MVFISPVMLAMMLSSGFPLDEALRMVPAVLDDDMAKAQILDAASLTAEGTSVDASAAGATKVKVFNWNNFTQLNRVNPAITLGL